MRGHWLGAQCPQTVGPGAFSSPTLAKLNAQVAKIAAVMRGEKAELARANALLAHQNTPLT